MDIARDMIRFALDMSRRIRARAVLIAASALEGVEEAEELFRAADSPLILLRSRAEGGRERAAEEILLPAVPLSPLARMKIAVITGICQGKLRSGDRLICLLGVTEPHPVDAVVFLEIGKNYQLFATGHLAEVFSGVAPAVFERVLDLAVILGSHGREGHPVGTTFVIGDTARVLTFCQAMVLNPFHGYPAEERNILDPALKETIMEFATIDGAFVVQADGRLEAAGVYLKPGDSVSGLPQGLGTRHYSSAGITTVTAATSVTVSASTGKVTVFHRGRIVIEIDPLIGSGSLLPPWLARVRG